MRVGVLRESHQGEKRVALVPAALGALAKKKLEILVERGAGVAAGHPDEAYAAAGARLGSRAEVAREAEALLMVRAAGANPSHGEEDLALFERGKVLIATMDPLGSPDRIEGVAARGVTAFALELLPRITRAQSMDVLSSMANLAGYKAVLIAANQAPRIFPMMMTAAGTIAAARVLVLGVGVAGLQAIATAKRLGAVVEAYDVRPEVREQVLSVGGKFVDLGLDTQSLSDKSGYAKAQSAEFIAKQQEALAQVVRANDVVITTAQVPGRRAPTLVTAAMMKGMKPGSVLVDLAAEQGGNCAVTKAGETIEHEGVTVIGPVNVASTMPFHASQLYAKNVSTFLLSLVDAEGAFAPKLDDEIVRDTLVARDGQVVNGRVRDALAQKKSA